MLKTLVVLAFISKTASALCCYEEYCDNGRYLANDRECRLTYPSWISKKGYRQELTKCPRGMYSGGFGSSSCNICPAGYYCPYDEGSTVYVEMLPCPTGQYSYAGQTGCNNCPSGYSCTEYGLLEPCQAGHLCTDDRNYLSRPRPCRAGYYCHAGTNQWSCPTGTSSWYTSNHDVQGGISECTPTPPGKGWVAANHPPIDCPKGYYNDDYFNTGCNICPIGFGCGGGAEKIKCHPGTYAPITGRPQCDTCPESFYCASPTSWPQPCPDGTYSTSGAAYCVEVPAGMIAPGKRYSTMVACADGEYSMTGDKTCTQCPAGYKCPEKHMKPQQCEAGSYAIPGQMECTLCPPGHYCPQNTRQPSICEQGMWAPQGSYQCYECPSGYKCDNTHGLGNSQTSNNLITDGSHSQVLIECNEDEMTNEFHTDCIACPAGYACPLQLHASIQPCGPGFYSTTSMNYCQVADGGTYAPTTIATPTAVSTGYYAEIGMTYQMRVFPNRELKTSEGRHTVQCKAGYFLKNYVCTAAAAGTFAPVAWASSGHRTAGLTCPDGTWSIAGMVECRICPPGYRCNPNNVRPSVICVNSFQIGGNKDCSSYVNGYEYSGQVLEVSGTYYKWQSTFSPCPIWTYADSGTLGDCKPCPDGYECYDGQKHACAAGKYSSAQNMGCLSCPPGYRCPATSGAPIECPGGQYALGGSSSCTSCPTDYYSEPASAYCTPVPPGMKKNAANNGIEVCPQKTYSDWGETGCTTCWRGFLCPEKTRFFTQELSCPRGSYCWEGVQTYCPAGTYGMKERAWDQTDGCYQCPSGYNCQPGTAHFLLAPCPKGAYCPNGIYTECPEGTTGNALYGASLNDCATCPAGTSCGAGATTATTCGQAYYCPTGVAAPGYPCPAGTFGGYMTGKTDPSQCLTCPPGYYCPEGSADPTPTPAGYYNPLQGIDSLDGVQLCPPKYYCPNEAMTNYLGFNCAAGHYCPAGTETQTQYPCPAGTYNDRIDVHDVKHCLPCPKGFKCGEGSTSTNGVMVQCAIGEFCELGASSVSTEIQCPAGTYSPYVQAMSEQDCLPCTPGFFCVKAASGQKQACPAGYYCPLGTRYGTQHPCPQGTYSVATGLADVNQCTACGVGNYCPDLAMSSPLQCADGYYNDYTVNALYCDLCPAGYSCLQADEHPVPCDEGYYSDRGALTCTRCPLGHYCAIKGTPKLTMLTQKCPAGTFCSATVGGIVGGLASYPNKNSQSNSGNACSKFHYCPEGTEIEIPIATLGYETILIEGAGYPSDGIITPAGYVSQDMTVCPAGYYCPAGTRSIDFAIKCPKGHYRTDTMGLDITDCGKCPAGFYCPNLGTVTPTVCPTGKYCPEGSERPSDCPLGTYNDLTERKDSRDCKACTANFYCPIWGQSAVDTTNHACDPGFVCYGGALRPEPTDKTTGDICPAGAFCDATGLNYCAQGKLGIFQGAYESSACQDCEKGFYCFGGNTGAVPCPAGYHCPEGTGNFENDSLKPQPGYYNIANQEAQMACPLGTFTKVPGQSECTNCEQGFWCRTTALGDPENDAICPAGFYCPSYDQIVEPTAGASDIYTFDVPYHRVMCPVGTYQPDISMTAVSDCQPCPASKACETKGNDNLAADLPDCAAGFFCKEGSPSRYPYTLSAGQYGPCPVGHYCEAGTADPVPCPAGTFSMQERAIDVDYCMVCPPGFLCETEGLSEPNRPVTAGIRSGDGITEAVQCSSINSQYCPLGSYVALQCYSGYYQDTAGQGYCKECPPGSYCINGTQQNCPAGYYCP